MKKFLSLLLSTMMMVSMYTVSSVSAYDTDTLESRAQIQVQESSDSVYGDFQYTVSGGKVTVTKYTGSAAAVSIPSKIEGKPVKNIGSFAFKNCSSLTNVEIPDSVTHINSSAFYGCSSLTNVEIPNSVTHIGSSAFYGCSSLTNIKIPDSVTTIWSSAFYGCSSLTSVTIPNSVTNIGASAFKNCSSLTSVTIGNSVTSIGNSA